MSKNSIKKNYLLNLSYQILTLIIPIVTTPYLSRVLGADGIGTYSYIESVSSYFVLFATLGLTTFGQREIAYVQDDKLKRSIVFWEAFIIGIIASFMALFAYILFSLRQTNWELYLVLVFNILGVTVNISWFFQGMEEFGKIVFRNTIFKLLNVIFIFKYIQSRDDLIFYFFVNSFFIFLNNLSYWLSIKEYVNAPKVEQIHPARHLKTVFSLFIPTIAIQVYTVVDKTMIGVITNNPFENGYYEQALKIAKIVLTIITALGAVMIPRIGYHYERGELQQVKSYMYRGYRFVWFLGIPLCFGLIGVAGNFVPWFFGEGYDKVVPLINILSFLILAIGINNVTGMQYLIPTKRQNLFTLTVLIGAVTNFILNLLLIYYFQSLGAAISSVLAETVIAMVQLWIVRKELSTREVLAHSGHYFIAGIIMLALLRFLDRIFLPSIIHTMIMVILGAIAYLGVLLVFQDGFLINNFRNISKRFNDN